MIHIVEEIELLLLLGNQHIRSNDRYLVTWNVKEFTVGYFLRLDKGTNMQAASKRHPKS
jgi:hypothetical protein